MYEHVKTIGEPSLRRQQSEDQREFEVAKELFVSMMQSVGGLSIGLVAEESETCSRLAKMCAKIFMETEA
jgi:hypothetical protein